MERRNLGKGDLEALRSEAKLLNELDHPNIVKLHGWYEEDKTLYMALELCEGERQNLCFSAGVENYSSMHVHGLGKKQLSRCVTNQPGLMPMLMLMHSHLTSHSSYTYTVKKGKV